jgi:hypothetical protein
LRPISHFSLNQLEYPRVLPTAVVLQVCAACEPRRKQLPFA